MKILAIGDPHGRVDLLKKIPMKNADLILLTGDLGKADLARERYFENVRRKSKGLGELEEDADFVEMKHNEIHESTIGVLEYLAKFAPVYTIQGNVGIPKLSQVREDNEEYELNLISTREKINGMANVSLIKNRLRILQGKRIGFLEWFTDTNWVREFKPSNYKERMKKAKKTDR